HVDLTVLDESFTLCGRCLAPVDGGLLPAIFFRDGGNNVGCTINIKTGHGSVGFAKSQTRLVKHGAQGDIARLDGAEQTFGVVSAVLAASGRECTRNRYGANG